MQFLFRRSPSPHQLPSRATVRPYRSFLLIDERFVRSVDTAMNWNRAAFRLKGIAERPATRTRHATPTSRRCRPGPLQACGVWSGRAVWEPRRPECLSIVAGRIRHPSDLRVPTEEETGSLRRGSGSSGRQHRWPSETRGGLSDAVLDRVSAHYQAARLGQLIHLRVGAAHALVRGIEGRDCAPSGMP